MKQLTKQLARGCVTPLLQLKQPMSRNERKPRYCLVKSGKGIAIMLFILLMSGQTYAQNGFSSNYQTACLNQKVFFAPDNPTGTFTWSVTPAGGWLFVNGTSASSTYPVIEFTTLGSYDISMQVGGNTVNKCKYIKVVQSQDNITYKTEGVWNGVSGDAVNFRCVGGLPAVDGWNIRTTELNFNKCNLNLVQKPNPNNLNSGVSEISSSISNIDGNELFYITGSDPITLIMGGGACNPSVCQRANKGFIYNRNHQVMLGTNGLIWAGVYPSRGILSLPMPGTCNSKYFVFTISYDDRCPGGPPTTQQKAYYHIVDMNGDNGLGEAISTNNLFDINVNECVTAVSQPNGYWIILHDGYRNEFRVYELTAGGFNTTPVQVITTGISVSVAPPQMPYYGEFKVSPTKNKLAFIWSYMVPPTTNNNTYFEIYDFNNTTGVMSSPVNVFPPAPIPYGLRSIEFSPTGNYVYSTRGDFDFLYRADLTGIPTLQTLPIPTPNASEIFALELAPNGKILITKSDNYIGAIESPDASTMGGISFNQNYMQVYPTGVYPRLGANLNNGTFTREILYQEGLIGSTRQKYICPNSSVNLSVTPTIPLTGKQWYSMKNGLIPGATANILSGVTEPGYYYFKGTMPGGRVISAHTLVKDYSCYDFGLKALYKLCPGSTINLQAKYDTCEAKTHRWYNAVTGVKLFDGPPSTTSTVTLGVGKYYLQVETFSGCFLVFNFEIKDLSGETSITGPTHSLCTGTADYSLQNYSGLSPAPTFSWGISPSGPTLSGVTTANVQLDYSAVVTDQAYVLTCTITTGSCVYTETFNIKKTTCNIPCDIDNSETQFTKSYTGPSGDLGVYSNFISSAYQQREVNFNHVKRLTTNDIVMAGHMLRDNINDDNARITNRELFPEFLFQQVPIIQKLNDKGDVLITKRIDSLIAAGANISLTKDVGLKRIAAMVTDASNNIYLLVTKSRKDYLEIKAPNFFEIIKLNSNLDPVTISVSQHNYMKVSFSSFENIYPSDMLLVNGVLRVLCTAVDPLGNHHITITNVATTLKNTGATKSVTLNVPGFEYSTGKMTSGSNNLYFLFNHSDNNLAGFTELMAGSFNLTTGNFSAFKSIRSATGGDIYPEGIKYDAQSSRVLVYGSVKMNNKHYPAFYNFDASLNLFGFAYYEYQPKTNNIPIDDVRTGVFGANAYIDDIFFHNNSFIAHTTIRGEMIGMYSQVANRFNMVPGYFSISRTANQFFAVDQTFPSVFDPNIFKVNDRQKYVVPAPGILGEQLSGKFEEHFEKFEKIGGLLQTSDWNAGKIYNMDGMRTLSVLENTYADPTVLTCFDTIKINKIAPLEYFFYSTWTAAEVSLTSAVDNMIIRTPKVKIKSSCCIPEYQYICNDIGDIQVEFGSDCQNNKVNVKFTGANVADIEMIQVYQVTPYDPTYNLGHFSDVLYNESSLTEININSKDSILKNGDGYCIVIYAKNGCMKQFCTTLEIEEPVTNTQSFTICDPNATIEYTPQCAGATYTLASNGGAPVSYNYPVSTPHNLGAGTHVFKSYHAAGCLKCTDTIKVNYMEPDTILHRNFVTATCGEVVNLFSYETCPITPFTSSIGLWIDQNTGIGYPSFAQYRATSSTTLRREVQYTNCTICIDEIILNVIPNPYFFVEICIPEEDPCQTLDLNMPSTVGCGPAMAGTLYNITRPGGPTSLNFNGVFYFCKPFDLGIHEITYVNQYGCFCSITVLVTQGPCIVLGPAPAEQNNADNNTSDNRNNERKVRILTPAQSATKIFPNPSSGVYNLVYTSDTGSPVDFNAEVYDISGKVVYRQANLRSNQYEKINLMELAPGFYTLKLIIGDKTESIKLIKN